MASLLPHCTLPGFAFGCAMLGRYSKPASDFWNERGTCMLEWHEHFNHPDVNRCLGFVDFRL